MQTGSALSVDIFAVCNSVWRKNMRQRATADSELPKFTLKRKKQISF